MRPRFSLQKTVTGLSDIAFRPVGLLFRLVGKKDAFDHGKWSDVARLFQHALHLDINDGPSQFYLNLTLEYDQFSTLVWEGFIRLKAR